MSQYYYSLVLEDLYRAQLAEIGDIERLEEALDAVYWALSTNPHAFDLVYPDRPIRLAKTNSYVWEGGEIPRLRIWFTIDEAELQVLLLAIKRQDDYN